MGTAGRVTNPSDVGIVPRVIEDIFQRKARGIFRLIVEKCRNGNVSFSVSSKSPSCSILCAVFPENKRSAIF